MLFRPLRRILAGAVAVAFGAVTLGQLPASAAEPRDPRPPLELIRHDEDWRFLRDAARREKPLDRLKHIEWASTGSAPSEVYVGLGSNLRLAYELFVNEDFGAIPQDDSGSLLFRGLVHADAWATSHVRGFVQLGTAQEVGRDGGPTPVDVDHFEITQGFLQLALGDPREPLAGETRKPSLSLRVGRQELRYGAGRLFDVREGPNVRLSFDAALVRATHPWATIDLLGRCDDAGGIPGLRGSAEAAKMKRLTSRCKLLSAAPPRALRRKVDGGRKERSANEKCRTGYREENLFL